jgi:hypothetical protein
LLIKVAIHYLVLHFLCSTVAVVKRHD